MVTFVLDADASDAGNGAVLTQIHQDGSEHAIAYASQTFRKQLVCDPQNTTSSCFIYEAFSSIPC